MSYYEIPSSDDPLALFEYSVQMATKNLSHVSHGLYPSYLNERLSRDNSQYEAFIAALENDITLSGVLLAQANPILWQQSLWLFIK